MKKWIFIVLFILASTILFINLSKTNQATENETAQNVEVTIPDVTKEDDDPLLGKNADANDVLSIEKSESQITDLKVWKDMTRFDQTITDLENEHSMETLAAELPAIATHLRSCLSKDLCGIKKRPEEDYFDETYTTAHQLLNRSLKLMNELLKEGYNVNISKEELLSIFKLESPKIDTRTVELYLLKEEDERELLRISPTITPQGFSSLMNTLIDNPEKKAVALSELNERPERYSGLSLSSMLENMNKNAATSEELTTLIGNICDRKNDFGEVLFKTLNYNLERVTSSKDLCP